MDDLISRQAAIDAIVNTPTDVYSHDRIVSVLDGAAFRQNEIIDIINALPSTVQEQKEEKMDDLISRQAAIDALDEEPEVWDEWVDEYAMGQREQWRSDRLSIETLPSAQKHGRWVVDPEGLLHCSNCKEIPTNRIFVNADLIYDMTPIKTKMKFCPNCGARMETKE